MPSHFRAGYFLGFAKSPGQTVAWRPRFAVTYISPKLIGPIEHDMKMIELSVGWKDSWRIKLVASASAELDTADKIRGSISQINPPALLIIRNSPIKHRLQHVSHRALRERMRECPASARTEPHTDESPLLHTDTLREVLLVSAEFFSNAAKPGIHHPKCM